MLLQPTRVLQLDETWPATPLRAPQFLVLTWGAHEIVVSERRPSLTVGRGGLSNMVIQDDAVSRLHARIEFRHARFSLTDQSSNGTYIAGSTGAARKVCNETHVLTGTGTISFGINPETGRTQLVRYVVNS